MIPVLFENDALVVFNKPEGIPTIPDRSGGEALISLVSPLFKEKLFVVHRLDRDVSGVILFAKHSDAHKELNAKFSDRLVEKQYVALVHGIVEEQKGIIDKRVRQFGSGRMGIDEKKGKESRTRFRVVKIFNEVSLLRLEPVTGRRHQLRVHLYSIGHPIVGDRRYGDNKEQQQYPRLMLHAEQVAFSWGKGKRLCVRAPWPNSFLAAFRKITQS